MTTEYKTLTIHAIADRMAADMAVRLAIASRALRTAKAAAAHKDTPANRAVVQVKLAWVDELLDEYLNIRNLGPDLVSWSTDPARNLP